MFLGNFTRDDIDYSAFVSDEPDQDVRRLVAEAVWEGPGGLLFRNRSVDWSRMRRTKTVIARSWGNELAAAILLIETSWGYYSALAVAAPRAQSRSIINDLMEVTVRCLTPGLRPDQVIAGLGTSDCFASHLEVARAGYVQRAEVGSVLFSRRRPRASPRCRHSQRGERAIALGELQALGRGWQDAPMSFERSEYFVYERDGRIVAGVQACPETWELLNRGQTRIEKVWMPALLGGDRHNFRFVQLFHLWGEPGCIEDLCEHVLHAHDAHLASIQLDPKDPLWSPLHKEVRRGLAARLLGADSKHVYATGPVPRPLSIAPIMGMPGLTKAPPIGRELQQSI